LPGSGFLVQLPQNQTTPSAPNRSWKRRYSPCGTARIPDFVKTLAISPAEAAAKEVAARVARKVNVDEMQPVDLVICGSVAVNRQGVRLGKGAGYSDIEVALLHEARLIGPETVIATTVHSLQVVDEPLPETEHDFSVDLIVTPDEVIPCGPARRPTGFIWEHLNPEKIAAIPVLAARAGRF
jgi:5-formyltetrahydrofolate cyclo-ligase